MGSKTKIADWVIDCLPPAEHFYDLFCGGCAVTHAAMLRHKYKHYHVNDITDMGMVFRKVIDGDYKPDYHWVSREEFEANKMNDLLMAMCWSFSNNGMDYLYSREREPIKKAAHMAVVFGDYTLADEVGMDLHYLEGIVGMDARYAKYKKNEKNRGGVLPQFLDNITRTRAIAQICEASKFRGRLCPSPASRKNVAECPDSGVYATKGDYQEVEILPNSIVYADCPYKGTHKYNNGQGEFDHERFYEWCRTREYPVFVSEYWMPNDFAPISIKQRTGSMCAYSNNGVRCETIFVHERFASKYKRDLFL